MAKKIDSYETQYRQEGSLQHIHNFTAYQKTGIVSNFLLVPARDIELTDQLNRVRHQSPGTAGQVTRWTHLVDERVYAMRRNGLSELQHHQDGNLAHWQRGGLAGSPGALVLR